MNGYGSLVWVNDSEGREFVCTLDSNRTSTSPKRMEELTEHERGSCQDTSALIGDERW